MTTTFTYDVSDTKKYPGLMRPFDDSPPYLTPVFFTKEVLIRYFYDPRYMCQFSSETYGTLLSRSNDFSIQFGVNPNNKILIWFGDLIDLPNYEQAYLGSENIQSDHNIDSEFYDAQINSVFTDPIREIDIFQIKYKIQEISSSKFNTNVFKTTAKESFEKIIDKCSKFKKITFGHEDDLKRFVSEWNELLVEDVDYVSIKTLLDKKGIAYAKDSKGNKVLEVFIKDVLNVSDNIISPFFYLYDLRIWADHSGAQSKYEGVATQLGLSKSIDNEGIYNALIDSILSFLKRFLTELERSNP